MPYQLNEVIPFEVIYRHTANGQPFAPTDAQMTVIAPDGTVSTAVAAPVGATVIYRRNVTANQAGSWVWFPVTSDEDITPTLYASVEVGQAWIEDLATPDEIDALPTAVEIRQEMDANSTQLANITAHTNLITVDTPITVVLPIDPVTGDVTLVRGDDYTLTSGRPIPSWTQPDWAAFDLTHAQAVTCRMRTKYVDTVFEKAVTVISGTQIVVEFTSAETAGFAVGDKAYYADLQAVLLSGDIVTLARFFVNIIEDVT